MKYIIILRLFNCALQGEYSEAFENFSRAYSISRSLNNNSSRLDLSRVLSGVAHAHEMLHDYTEHINCTPSARMSVDRLLDWKDCRHEQFDKPSTPPPGTLIYCVSQKLAVRCIVQKCIVQKNARLRGYYRR